MGAWLDPGANDAALVIGWATADCLDVAGLPRISQPIVRDISGGEVGRPIKDGHLVVLLALVGTWHPVDQDHVHRPLDVAIQGRVPPRRLDILAEDVGFYISRKLHDKY